MNKKFYVIIILFAAPFFFSCKKKTGCNTATITKTGTLCSKWGIQVDKAYPSLNIPDEFKQEGLKVCVEYELFEDLRLCVCCGGIWANVKSIRHLDD